MSAQNKKIACIIPARYASTRLPAKPLIEVKGIPLVMWGYNRAKESGVFDTVCVATDDQRIYDKVYSCGGYAVMTSANHQSGTDRVNEAMQKMEHPCDFVVNLQGDEPLIPIPLLQEFAERLTQLHNLALLTCVSDATIEDVQNPNVVKVVLDKNARALYFSRAPIPYIRDNDNGTFLKHIGIYGFTSASLSHFCSLQVGLLERMEKLEQLRALEEGMDIFCLKRNYTSIGIDTPQDIAAFCRMVEDSCV